MIGDELGGTALHYAAQNNHIDCIDAILKYVESPDSLDDEMRTPLYWAAQNACVEACDLILTAGASTNHVDATVGVYAIALRNHYIFD